MNYLKKIGTHITEGTVINRIINARKIRLEKEWTKFQNCTTLEFKIKTKSNLKIKLYKDSELSRLIYQESFENDIIQFIEKYLERGDTFIDIGANIGLFSLIAAKVIKRSGQIYSFEPSIQTYNRLKENILLNDFQNIDCINIAISDKEETKILYTSLDGFDAWNTFGKFVKSVNYKSEVVKTITLDSFMVDKANKIKLIKIDVEGWELPVIKGASKILKAEDAPTLIIEFNDDNAKNAGFNCFELYEEILSLGYNFYNYDVKKNTLNSHVKLDHYVYENLIAVKPEVIDSIVKTKKIILG